MSFGESCDVIGSGHEFAYEAEYFECFFTFDKLILLLDEVRSFLTLFCIFHSLNGKNPCLNVPYVLKVITDSRKISLYPLKTKSSYNYQSLGLLGTRSMLLRHAFLGRILKTKLSRCSARANLICLFLSENNGIVTLSRNANKFSMR